MSNKILEDDRRPALAIDLEIEDRTGVGKSLSQLARLDLEGDWFRATSVDNPGHIPGAPQAACFA